MTQNGLKPLTPVYLPYATLISSLDNLKAHGIPTTGKIDKSLWETQSGAVQGQILIAFRFLGLIDQQNRVQPGLEPLVLANPDERKTLLRQLLHERYQSVMALDLQTVSPLQLDDAFKELGVTGSTHKRAVRFFVKACQELEIPLSRRVAEKTRSSGASPRKKRVTVGNGPKPNLENPRDPVTPAKRESWEEKLLEKFPAFDPSWPEELQNKWFDGFDRLMGKRGGQ